MKPITFIKPVLANLLLLISVLTAHAGLGLASRVEIPGSYTLSQSRVEQTSKGSPRKKGGIPTPIPSQPDETRQQHEIEKASVGEEQKSQNQPVSLKVWHWIGMIGTIVAILTVLFSKTGPWIRSKIDSYRAFRLLGRDFPKENIEKSIRYYIQPFCQDIDPSGGEEPRAVVPVQEKLFHTFDKFLEDRTQYSFVMLLADSGMGKSSALIKYYLRHNRVWRKWRRRYDLKLIALGSPQADELIRLTPNKSETVLLLDAFDEDTRAIADHSKRLIAILEASVEFRGVMVSCRTQFFPRDEEIPRETGILILGPRAAGKPAEHTFHKLYLSPFSDKQARTYIVRRFRFAPVRERRARKMAAKIPHLTARPMLLAHIDDLVKANRQIKYAYELYEEMISAWAEREEPRVRKEDLLQFSDRLAVNLYTNSSSRYAERIPRSELALLAQQWKIPLDEWKVTSRSLLNRDAEGNYKFAHRSIMEYLLVKRFVNGDESFIEEPWTDEMQTFLWEMLQSYSESGKYFEVIFGKHWNSYDLSQQERRSLLIGHAVLVGLQKGKAKLTYQDYDNICGIIVRLCMSMLSPYSCSYPEVELIKPSQATSKETSEPSNDVRVTLYDVTGFPGDGGKFVVLGSDAKQVPVDLPPPRWQEQTPSFPYSAIDEANPIVKGREEYPYDLYISALNRRTAYLLGVQSSSELEIDAFRNRYGSLVGALLGSLPNRPKSQ